MKLAKRVQYLKTDPCVQRLTLGPNDVLVVNVPGMVSHEMAERMKSHMMSVFPRRKMLVISGGITLGAITELKVAV